MKLASIAAGSDSAFGVVRDDHLIDLRPSCSGIIPLLEATLTSEGRDQIVAAVNVSIYQPAYMPYPDLVFVYEDETHAYFPVAHFDEVVRDGHWTYGKRGDAYVALYSRNAVVWRGNQPEVFQNGGLDFDLVAEGSASNVWIVEMGSASEWPGGFASFQAAFDESLVSYPDVGGGPLQVAYDSPSQGTVSFGWEADMVVDGTTQPIAAYKRYENPFVQTDFRDTRYEVADGEYSLVLDFADLEAESQDVREATSPPEGS